MKLDQGVIPGACLHLRRAIVNMEKPGTRTRWRLWDKNDLNHSHNDLGTDFWYNFFKRMLWSTKSKALRKSTKTVRTAWPLSREVVHKCSAETSACKVDRPASQPNCCWSSWGVTRSSIHFLIVCVVCMCVNFVFNWILRNDAAEILVWEVVALHVLQMI